MSVNFLVDFVSERRKTNKIFICFNGSAGCGKSFALNNLSKMLRDKDPTIHLEKKNFNTNNYYDCLFLFDTSKEILQSDDVDMGHFFHSEQYERIEFINSVSYLNQSNANLNNGYSEWKVYHIKNKDIKDDDNNNEMNNQFIGNSRFQK